MIAEDKLNRQVELVLSIPLDDRKTLASIILDSDRKAEKQGDKENEIERILKLCQYLYLYVVEKFKNNKQFLYEANYEEYGLEIFQTSVRSIGNYDKNHKSGKNFLSYFINNWIKECSRIRGRITIEKKQVHVPDKVVRRLRVLIKYLKEHDIIFSPTLHTELAAEVMNVTPEEAKEIINMHFLQTGAFVILDDESEEISILETIPDENAYIEEILIKKENYQKRKENWNKVMDQIEEGYLKGYLNIGNSPKLYVIDVFTCDIADVLLEFDENYGERYSYHYSFINIPMMDEILSLREKPLQKEIAQKYNIKQSQLSRDYSKFRRKIRDYMLTKTKSDLQQEQK